MMKHEQREKPLILVVDDDRAIVHGLNIRLRSAGYEVLKGYDGEAGLAAAIETRPDLIVLDIRMPRMDGLTMLARVREHDEINAVPVIVLSANIADQVRTKALQLKARYFIEKPYEAEKLILAIQSALRGDPTCTDDAAVA